MGRCMAAYPAGEGLEAQVPNFVEHLRHLVDGERVEHRLKLGRHHNKTLDRALHLLERAPHLIQQPENISVIATYAIISMMVLAAA